MSTTTAIVIQARLEGADAVRAEMNSLGQAATTLQGVGGARYDLQRETANRLEVFRRQIRVVGDEADRFRGRLGGLDPVLTRIGGQLLGIDPTLMRLGVRFGAVGAAAAAGLAVVNASIEAVRATLADLDLRDEGKLGTLFNTLGITQFERDPNTVRARAAGNVKPRLDALYFGEEGDPRAWKQRFEEFIEDMEVNVFAGRRRFTPDELRQHYKDFRDADQESPLAGEFAFRESESKRLEMEYRIRRRRERFEADAQEGRAMQAEADRIKRQAEARDRQEQSAESNRLSPVRDAWMREMQSAAGFAPTTLANSREGAAALNAARMGAVRDTAAEKQFAELVKQTNLLERIAAQPGTTTVGF